MPDANENTPENPLGERTSTRTRVRPAEDNAEVSHTPRITNSEFTFGPPAVSGEVGTLGPYRVLKELGKGGMGAVYLAIDTRLEREIALKVMLPAFAADPGAKERFLREAKAVAKVSHDNVVTVFEADERDGVPYIAMQFLRGYPLDDYLKKKGSPSIAHCVRIAREAALGLAAAHKRGLVHRDIKPANLWLEAPNGRVKVLDFGLAKPISSNTKLTETGAVVGTPAYMSPEQASGQKVDHRTDIFSLGTLLYRLLTGRTPFTGDHILAVLTALAVEEPTPVRELKPSVPPALAELVHQMLAKKPDARPQTATEVAERLRTVLSQANEEVSDSLPVAIEPIPEPTPMEITAIRKSSLAVPVDDETDEQTEREPASGRDEATAPKSKKRLLLAVGVIAWIIVVGVAIAYNNRKTPGEVAKNPEPQPQPQGKIEPKGEPTPKLPGPNEKKDPPTPPIPTPKVNCQAAEHWIAGRIPSDILTLNGHKGKVTAASFSPDGTRIVTASDDNTAKVWDANTGDEILTLKGHSQAVSSVAYNNDGKLIVTGSWDRTAKIWDAKTGQNLQTLKEHSDNVVTVGFSPDGTQVLAGCRSGVFPGSVRVWDVKTGAQLHVHSPRDDVNASAFSPDGSRIITAGSNKTCLVWDTKTGSAIHTLNGHKDALTAASFSPDGKRIVTSSKDNTVKVWDAQTGTEIDSLLPDPPAPALGAAFSADNMRIVTVSREPGKPGKAKIWDAKSGTELLKIGTDNHSVTSAAFSSNGKLIVTSGEDGTAKVWEPKLFAEILTFKGHTHHVHSAAFSPDGTKVVTGSRDQTAKVWDAKTGKEIVTFNGHKESVIAAAFNPDGTRIVTASADETAKVWDAKTGEELHTLKHKDHVYTASFSPDGLQIVTGSLDRTAKIWDAKTGKEIRTLTQSAGSIGIVAFSKDGSRILTAGTQVGKPADVNIYDAKTYNVVLSLKGHRDGVGAAMFNMDGTCVVTGSEDWTAKVWDAKTSKEIFTLRSHTRTVYAASFSHDGLRIVTGSNEAKVWNAKTGEELFTLTGHKSNVTAAVFSPDGTRILTASSDHTAKVWAVAPK